MLKNILPQKPMDLIIPALVAVFNVLIILFPKDMIDAARDGLNLWWGSVIPSLLPFIIGVGILTSLGAVNFVGTLLEPIMYKLFGVPGAGGFALITGMTSGYPVGAKIVAMLRKKKDLTQAEAQRLISFANNSGPLFIVGAVGIGMLGSAKLGYIILAAHYLGALMTGMIFRHYKYSERRVIRREKRLLSKAVYNMRLARAKDGFTFGKILGDAVKNAMETIAQVGGFIILFSVIVKVFGMAEIAMAKSGIPIGSDILRSIIKGAIEITNGCKEASKLVQNRQSLVILCAGLTSFGGLSVHAQALSFLGGTDIKSGLYFVAKLVHAGLAAAIAGILCMTISLDDSPTATEAFLLYREGFWSKLTASSLCFLLSVFIIAITIIFAGVIRKRIK